MGVKPSSPRRVLHVGAGQGLPVPQLVHEPVHELELAPEPEPEPEIEIELGLKVAPETEREWCSESKPRSTRVCVLLVQGETQQFPKTKNSKSELGLRCLGQ
jgi:hypothetical protein